MLSAALGAIFNTRSILGTGRMRTGPLSRAPVGRRGEGAEGAEGPPAQPGPVCPAGPLGKPRGGRGLRLSPSHLRPRLRSRAWELRRGRAAQGSPPGWLPPPKSHSGGSDRRAAAPAPISGWASCTPARNRVAPVPHTGPRWGSARSGVSSPRRRFRASPPCLLPQGDGFRAGRTFGPSPTVQCCSSETCSTRLWQEQGRYYYF